MKDQSKQTNQPSRSAKQSLQNVPQPVAATSAHAMVRSATNINQWEK